MTVKNVRDIRVENHGSLVLFQPLNDSARSWLLEHTEETAPWFGNALCVEPRYAQGLTEVLKSEGFSFDETTN
jgi:hypothetical protein